MSETKTCACGADPKLVFLCSGGADGGVITDRTACRVTCEKVARGRCT
jgi:uncharacterized metal-binding protein